MINEQIERCWQSRLGGVTPEFKRSVDELAALPLTKDDKIQLELLRASIDRFENHTKEAEVRLLEIEQAYFHPKKPLPFQYYFQKALNAFARGHFSTAMADFVTAAQMAPAPQWAQTAQVNRALCLEALGLPVLDHVHDLLQTKTLWPADREQLETLKMRHRLWRFGELPLESANALAGQGLYFFTWACHLPYVKIDSALRHRLTLKFSTEPTIFRHVERTKTLLYDANDPNMVSDRELPERLYLWTWQWLVTGNRELIRGIFNLVREIESRSPARLFPEDQQFIMNSFGWLGLFAGPLFKQHLESAAAKVAKNTDHRWPLLSFEETLIQYLHCRQNHERLNSEVLKQKLMSSPFMKGEQLGFHVLMDGRFQHQHQGMLGSLHLALQSLLPEPLPSRIRVNEQTHHVQIRGHGALISSAPLSRAITLIKNHDAISFDELSWECFRSNDAKNFDPSRIYNLVARLKRILSPEIQLKTKDATLFVTGDKSVIQIISPSPLKVQLNEAFLEFAHGRSTKKVGDIWISREKLTRFDLQNELGISKSSAHRLLQKLVKKGQLKVVGKGQHVQYVPASSQKTTHKNNSEV